MMKAHPAASLVMREPELLLEILVVPLDAPAHLGDEDQLHQRRLGRDGGEEILVRLNFSFRPFDQQPLLGTRLGAQRIPMRGADQALGGSGPVPGAHTVVAGRMPTA